MGIRDLSTDGALSIIKPPAGRRQALIVAIIVAAMLAWTLAACNSSRDLGAANVWPLTAPEASTGGVTLSMQGGAQWTGEGLLVEGTGFASTSAPGPVATDSNFTVGAWVRPKGQPGQNVTVLTQAGQTAGAFFLGVNEGFWSFSVKPKDGNGDNFVTNRDRATRVEVTPDRWVHLAGVYDTAAGKARFYLNGFPVSEQGIATDHLFAAQGALLFGRGQSHGEPEGFFKGTIYDVRTWPRALGADEVAAVAQIAAPSGATLDRPEQSAPFICPNPHGGICLGPLEPGTKHETTSFEPKLSYTVPKGWSNEEDLPGQVLLLRPSDPQEGVWGGSYIGVYQNVRAAAQCSEEAQPGVGTSAAELAAWYRTVPGLEIAAEAPTSLGGLTGIALDFRVSDDWKSTCPLGGLFHAVPLMVGGGVSDFYHAAGAPLEIRLILLDWRGGNVAVEVTALRAQWSLNDYLREAGAGDVVESFKFGS
ncbi:LamG domain-containing protein [Pseudarthrobacter sp. B4EP4b]|uniref:LamG domain-containing protein n=1 Tax=Pseudarthrobacter sp. B4EP4b TaxID=2590664 RepID=UPI00114DEEF6|nr:LamG domain-containing protein [Pseudarthrobacter sp. B4EP4b]